MKWEKRFIVNLLDYLKQSSNMNNSEYQLLDLKCGQSKLTAKLFIPHTLSYFDGHFDEISVLPGVVQLNWAIEFAIQEFNLKGEFKAIDNMKFTRIIKPNSTVDLKLEYLPNKEKLVFSYHSGDLLHSNGKIQVV